jgi:tetratricopeptide (TPR) repeat protein
MKRPILALMILCISLAGRADEAMLQFEQANQAYRSAAFEQAVTIYERILSTGQESASLYYNLGNAYFKLQNMPGAILNYERALRLAPGDEDVRYNLRLANLRVIDKIEPVPELFFVEWWNGVLSLFSSSGWGAAAIALLWCAAFAAGLMLATRSFLVQRVMLVLVLLALSVGGLALAAAFQRSHLEGVGHGAIVFAASVPVKSAPDQKGTDLFVLHEGVKVELLDEVGVWRKIRLADGKVGWMPLEAMTVI